MTINYEKLGQRIRQLRKEKGITQEQLAEKVGMDPRTILEVENGKRENPTLKTLSTISEALGTDLQTLLK